MTACGWPTTSKDSHSAWLLAQHADSDIAFQRLAKGLLEASVKAGIAAPRDLAYLADRIAANEGRPQEYGRDAADLSHLTVQILQSSGKRDECFRSKPACKGVSFI